MERFFCVLVAIYVFGIHSAFARPVSYQGGWTIILEHDRQATSGLLHYTIRPDLSIGARTLWDRRQDVVFQGVQSTYLAKRWYGENYQANIYLLGAAGAAFGVGNHRADLTPAGIVGVMSDWETRRFFLSYRARYLEAGQVASNFVQAARVGIAPYIANTGALHTWLMIEVDHRPENPDKIGVTPFVRLFKGQALFEAGYSLTDDRPVINFTYRF